MPDMWDITDCMCAFCRPGLWRGLTRPRMCIRDWRELPLEVRRQLAETEATKVTEIEE